MKTAPILLVYLLILSLASGFLLGLGRDLLLFAGRFLTRLFSKLSAGKKRTYTMIQFVQDLLFCTVIGCILTVILFYYSEGRFRFFAVMVLVVGFVLYRHSIGLLFCRYSVRLSEKLADAVSRLFVCLTAPILRLLRWLLRCASTPIKACHQKIKGRRLLKYGVKRTEELRKMSGEGFVNIQIL